MKRSVFVVLGGFRAGALGVCADGVGFGFWNECVEGGGVGVVSCRAAMVADIEDDGVCVWGVVEDV